MNRLHAPKAHTFKLSFPVPQEYHYSPSSSLTSADAAWQHFDRREDLRHSLFAPLHYERGYAYPLIVWLHGDGGNERELRQIMPHVSMRNYVAVGARGGCASAAVKHGFTWLQSASGGSEASDCVEVCIEAAKRRFNVNPQRVFIAGHGLGGTMALRLALQFPEWFAGAVSLGGPMPLGNCPLKCVNDARRLPLLLATCRHSAEYPPSRVAEDLRLLHSAGFSLALRQYPGSDCLTTGMLADMDRWIMDKICATASAASSA